MGETYTSSRDNRFDHGEAFSFGDKSGHGPLKSWRGSFGSFDEGMYNDVHIMLPCIKMHCLQQSNPGAAGVKGFHTFRP